MKILIEEKDETQEYRIVPIDQFVGMVLCQTDRIQIFVPNTCGGETRITVYRTTCPDGNPDNLERMMEHLHFCNLDCMLNFIKGMKLLEKYKEEELSFVILGYWHMKIYKELESI